MSALHPVAEFTLLGVNGDTINLTDPDSKIRMGPSPLLFGDAPPVINFTQSPAVRAGEVLDTAPRDGGVPRILDWVILGESQNDLFEQVERLVVATKATRGSFLIVAKRPEAGTERSLRLYRTEAISPDFGEYDGETLTFSSLCRAPHPYWADLVPKVVQLDFPITGTGLTDTGWDEDMPWDGPEDEDIPWDGWQSVGDDGIVAGTIHSAGSAPSWPRWEIAGPFTGAEIVNASSPERPIVFNGTLEANETLVIETRPHSVSARVGSTSRIGEFDLVNTDFWSLVEGENSITVQVGGYFTTDTRLRMSFIPHHETC